jgi:DNA-binding CsgD family transcriptional regulator
LSYLLRVDALKTADARRLLDFVAETSAVAGPEPFPRPVLSRLAELIPCGNVGYFEWDRPRGVLQTYNQGGEFDIPAELDEAALTAEALWPPAGRRQIRAGGAAKLSDFIGSRALVRTTFYSDLMRPIGVKDELKVFLRPVRPRVAGFSLVGRGFTERDRLVLDLLAPHLVRARERILVGGLIRVDDVELTEREWEILAWVARGKTNKEIAWILLIAPDTTRKHLENVFRKLGVHTRTGAVARAFAPSRADA